MLIIFFLTIFLFVNEDNIVIQCITKKLNQIKVKIIENLRDRKFISSIKTKKKITEIIKKNETGTKQLYTTQ